MAPSAEQTIPTTRLERAGEVASRVASLSPEDARLRRALHASIGLILLLGVGLALITTLDQIPDLEWRVAPGWLLLALVAFALHVLSVAEIWRRLLAALGPALSPLPGAA